MGLSTGSFSTYYPKASKIFTNTSMAISSPHLKDRETEA